MKTFVSIQHLRGFAALAVVLFHACQWAGVDFDIGAGGVDVFFVISGFVLWTAAQARPATPGLFLWRRIVRVVPAYWAVTLLLAGLVAAWPGLLPQVRLEGPHHVLSLLLVPHMDPAGLPFPLLPPGWSLSYEAIFYLVFAAGLAVPARNRFAAVIAGLVIIGLTGFLIHPAYELGANPTMLEFAAGVWLGKACAEGRTPPRAFGWALLAAGLGAFAALRLWGLHSDLWRNLIWGVPALAIVAGAVCIEADGGVAALPALKLLGDGSYSLYLVHWIVVALLAKALGAGNPWLFIPLAVAASLGAGLLARQALEKPLIARLGPPSARPRAAG
jgi:exopolysaccharide production protein ExoZ